MKLREIVLDFTPLLDITMIILFYFVLFSNFNRSDAQKQAEADLQTAREMQTRAEQMTEQAADTERQYRLALDRVMQAEGQTAENTKAVLAFAEGSSLKIMLAADPEGWNVRIYQGTEPAAAMLPKDVTAAALADVLRQLGYQRDSVILCQMIYDGSKPGSRNVYFALKKELEALRKQYAGLYISETNLSM